MKGRWFARAGRLWAFHVQIDHNRVLAAAHYDGFARFVGFGIDLLMWHLGRNVDEIARSSFASELQVVTPAHAGAAFDDVKNSF